MNNLIVKRRPILFRHGVPNQDLDGHLLQFIRDIFFSSSWFVNYMTSEAQGLGSGRGEGRKKTLTMTLNPLPFSPIAIFLTWYLKKINFYSGFS